MNSEKAATISVTKPVGLAVERVKSILFDPFDTGKWFTIGFCAWLAFLGEGGMNFNFNSPFGGNRSKMPFSQMKGFFADHMSLILLLGSIGLIIGLVIVISLLWLSCRGKFMFLYCIAENKAEVKIPWHKYSESANSLLLFKIVSGLIAFICITIFMVINAVLIIPLVESDFDFNSVDIMPIVLACIITISVLMASGIFFKFTNDFIIPIMYLSFCSGTQAWCRFLKILLARKGAFTLYLLFQVVIGTFIGVAMLALVLATCCCAGLLFAIPYIGTVLMLPVLVFKRAYSLYYLRQFGGDFDVFAFEVISQSDLLD